MKACRFALLAGLLFPWLGGVRCQGGELDLNVQQVLAKWEKASQDCRSLDAKLTVFEYSAFWPEQPRTTHGRLYYEAPHSGYCQLRDSVETATKIASTVSETTIWRNQETLLVHGRSHTCEICSKPLPKLDDKAAADSSWLRWIETLQRHAVRQIDSPQQAYPFLIDVRASDVQERFDVSLERRGGEIMLKAVPKRSADKVLFRDIRVILDAKTYRARATQMNSPNGRDRTVYVLEEHKVNQRPSDRDAMFNPDLAGFKVTRLP